MPDKAYSHALLTDLYQLTMAQVEWRNEMTEQATFSLFFRGYPKGRGYYAAAGIDSALEILESFEFSDEDLNYLSGTSKFAPDFLEYLESLVFTGTVRAVSEGTAVFADEPVLEVTAPLVEAQVVETLLLNTITFQTNVLTKATMIVSAADGKQVFEFGARRAHSPDTADTASKAALTAGFAGTSNLGAAAQFDLPIIGTMAHSFVQSYESELEAFRAYAREFPESTTLLVDTYDTITGVKNAALVGKEMESNGDRLRAIRIDSGDLAAMSSRAREMLDAVGLGYVRIVVSGGLDEHSIAELVSTDAPIDGIGVGTRYVTTADTPYIDSVYKLVSYAGRDTGKFSSGKSTLPGRKQVYRRISNGKIDKDLLATASEDTPQGFEPLLDVAMENGRRIKQEAGVKETARYLKSQLDILPDGVKKLVNPTPFTPEISKNLQQVTEAARKSQTKRS